MREQRQQKHRVPSEFSCGQPRISQPLSAHCSDETIQPFEGVNLYVAFVQPPCKFIGITANMLGADVVEGSVNSPLENGPNGFDGVSAGRASRVFPSTVVHGFMFKKQAVKVREHNAVIGIKLRPKFDVAVNLCCDGLHGAFIHRGKDGATVTFAHSKHGSFADSTASSFQLFMLMLVPFLAADETLVKFHDALQLGDNFRSAASLAQPMQDEPRGFLRNSDLLGELKAADALTRCDQQIHCVNPLMKWNVAALENGSGANGEFQRTGVAIEVPVAQSVDSVFALAFRAYRAIRPQARLQVESRCFLIGEGLEELERADRGSGHLASLFRVKLCWAKISRDVFPSSMSTAALKAIGGAYSEQIRFVHLARVAALVADAAILNFGKFIGVAVVTAYRFVNAVVVRMLLSDRFAGWNVWHKVLSGDALQCVEHCPVNVAASIVCSRILCRSESHLEGLASAKRGLNSPFTFAGTGRLSDRASVEIAPDFMPVLLAAFIAFVSVHHVNNVHNFQMEVNYYIRCGINRLEVKYIIPIKVKQSGNNYLCR